MSETKEERKAIEDKVFPVPEDLDLELLGRTQIGFDVVELTQIDLKPGGILMVTVKNDDMNNASINALRNQLRQVFPNNQIFVFGMGTADDVKFTAINQESVAKSENVGYCTNCDCGKKELAEQNLEGKSDGKPNTESCCGNQCDPCGSSERQ